MFEPKCRAKKYKSFANNNKWLNIMSLKKGNGISLLAKKLENEYKNLWALVSIKAKIGVSDKSLLKEIPRYV